MVHVVAVKSTNVKALVTATVAHLQDIAAQQVVTVPQAARAHSGPAQSLTSRPTVPAVERTSTNAKAVPSVTAAVHPGIAATRLRTVKQVANHSSGPALLRHQQPNHHPQPVYRQMAHVAAPKASSVKAARSETVAAQVDIAAILFNTAHKAVRNHSQALVLQQTSPLSTETAAIVKAGTPVPTVLSMANAALPEASADRLIPIANQDDQLLDFVIPPKFKNHYTFVENIVTQRLEEKRKREKENTPIEREDTLHFLCSAKDPDTGAPAFGRRDLLGEANLLIMAGSDTTSITISSLLVYLTHNRRAYLKLIEEIRDMFLSAEDIVHGPKLLTDCKYLRACIDKTSCVSPAGPIQLAREVLAGGTSINGEHYSAGVVLGTPNWAMGRNEAHYGDAYTFGPEQWVVSDELESFVADDVRRLIRSLHTFFKRPGDCVG
ncbi:hypothetical protein HBH65_231460 [Parastagonospora nodorum]|nr:hypothetical protein HBH65_231460 [Parastagonospora nodorum]KAH4760427.1 hypothetical protein HBH63_215050 [Parastagonospora nodorum]KAH6384280.1 hypothetical protein HBI14_218210 [Parastagonospora nodorum]